MSSVPDVLSVVLRAAGFVLLLQAAGLAMFLASLGRFMPKTRDGWYRPGLRLAIAAVVLVAAHHFLEAARMAGDMSGMLDPSMQWLALQSSVGAAFAVRIAGLALVIVGLLERQRWVGVAGALLAVVSFSLTGHTSVAPHRWVSAALLTLHLFVVAFWIGALWPLHRACAGETPADAARVIDRFSAFAVWAVPCIGLVGIGLAVILLPDLAVFSRPYGQLLLAKAGGFAALLVLAGLNKWRLGPGVGRSHDGTARAFRRTVAVEYVLICCVLAVTAVMTTYYSPEAA